MLSYWLNGANFANQTLGTHLSLFCALTCALNFIELCSFRSQKEHIWLSLRRIKAILDLGKSIKLKKPQAFHCNSFAFDTYMIPS